MNYRDPELLNRLAEMQKAPYYATACHTLVKAEMLIVQLEKELVEALAYKQDAERLDWLEADTACKVCPIGRSWYRRKSWGYPLEKQKTLRAAIDASRAQEVKASDASKGVAK